MKRYQMVRVEDYYTMEERQLGDWVRWEDVRELLEHLWVCSGNAREVAISCEKALTWKEREEHETQI